MVKVEPLKEEENGPIPGLHREEILPESGGIIVSEGPGQTNREYSGWDVYNNEAKKVDTELVNDWRDSLNSLLLFVSVVPIPSAPYTDKPKILGCHLFGCSHRIHYREQEHA